MKRRWTVVATLALLGVAWAAWGNGSDEAVWRRVERRDLVLGVPMQGELQAVVSQQIGPPQVERIWNFQISMMVPEGSEVEPGQPVLAFDTTELQRRLQEAVAEADSSAKQLEKLRTDKVVETRQLSLQLAEAQGRRRRAELKTDSDASVIAAADLEKAGIDRTLAQSEIEYLEEALRQKAIEERVETANLEGRLELARTRVTQLQESIERMTVSAERSGTVIHKTDWRGDKRQIGEQVWRAAVVLEIPDLSEMEAAAEVAEANAGRLEVGQDVSFRLDAYPDIEYRGTVSSIRRAVQRKSRDDPGKVVRLKLALEATDSERMRPGMRFRGTVVAERLEQLLAVPSEAIFSDADGPYVYVRSLLGRRRVNPELGRRNQDWVEVVSGLAAGDRVLGRAGSEGSER